VPQASRDVRRHQDASPDIDPSMQGVHRGGLAPRNIPKWTSRSDYLSLQAAVEHAAEAERQLQAERDIRAARAAAQQQARRDEEQRRSSAAAAAAAEAAALRRQQELQQVGDQRRR